MNIRVEFPGEYKNINGNQLDGWVSIDSLLPVQKKDTFCWERDAMKKLDPIKGERAGTE